MPRRADPVPESWYMRTLFAALGRFSIRYRWLVIGLWLAGAVASVLFLPSLAAAVNNNNTQYLPASMPSNVAAHLDIPFSGSSINDDAYVVAATANHQHLTKADVAAIYRLTADAARLPHAQAAQVAEFSGDGQAAQIAIRANLSQATNTPDVRFVHALRGLFGKVGAPPNLVMHTAGNLAITADQANQASGLGAKTMYLSIGLIILILLAVFRSPLATVATLLPAVVVLFTAESVVGEVASLGIGISSITQLLLIVLVLGAGTDYGLFLVFRVREERRRGLTQHQAIERAVERVGESIVFSAGTVITALLSLLLATFGIYHGLAVPLAIGIALMVLAALTLVPAMLAVFGRALFWPAQPVAGQRTSGGWGRLASRVAQRPVAALLIGVIGLTALASFSLADRDSDFGGGISAPAGSDSAKGQALLVEHFTLASSNPINLVMTFDRPVWSDPLVLATAGASLDKDKIFSSFIAPLDPNGTVIPPAQLTRLHRVLGPPGSVPAVQPTHGPAAALSPALYQAYRATPQVISADGHTVQFMASLQVGSPDSNAAIGEVPTMRADLASVAMQAGASANGVAGDSPSLYDVKTASNNDLMRIIPVAVLIIGLLLGLMLRSVVAPLYLVVSVALSFLASLGASVIVFEKFGGNYGLSFILPFLMFVFLLALGEDYNILVMSRIREEAHNLSLREAVSRAIEVTGTTVTSAGMVLAGTFMVFAIAGASGAEGAQIQEIGIGLAIGVTLDTFVVRTLVVPATVVILGRWNWWPAELHERHERLERTARERIELAGETPGI
jgi:putative drug exporter of the RND superfamily